MNLKNIRAHKMRSRWMEGVFYRNPVFILGVALPFAIMITTSLKNAVAISILQACSLIPTVILASLIRKRIPQWILFIIVALFSMIVILASLPLISPISQEIFDSLGIYIPILSINTLLCTLCRHHSEKKVSPILTLADTFCYSIGFSLALCMIAFVRELFGNHTLWSVPVSLPIKFQGLNIAFSGFILAGLFSALFHSLRRVYTAHLYLRDNPCNEKKETSIS